MKHLSDYLNKRMNEIHAEHGCFYAFTMAQFNERRIEGVAYCTVASGLIVPTEHVDVVIRKMDHAIKESIKDDLAENSKQDIIRRELRNYESTYCFSMEAAYEQLKLYDFTKEEVAKEFRALLAEGEY